MKKKKIPVFPKYSIERKDKEITIKTNLRKQDKEGVWYLQKFRKTAEIDSKEKEDKLLQNFIEETYHYIVMGKVTKVIDAETEEPIFELDKNQQSEEERLKKIIEKY